MRKLISVMLASLLVLSTLAVGYAAPKGSDWVPPGQAKKMAMFNDVSGHWAESTINELAENGMVKGYGNGKFMPNNPVTKLESLVMLYEAADGESEEFDLEDHDLYKGPVWGQEYYAWAWENGAFGDSTKSFNANAAITRAEFAFYAANLNVDDEDFDWDAYEGYTNDYDDDEDIDDECEGRIGFMNRFRLMIGDGESMFRGGGALNRAEAAMVMQRLINFDYGEATDPWAKIYVDEEDGCATSLTPEIEIHFNELVFDDDGDQFTKTSAADVISFEDESNDVEFDVSDIERTATKEVWTIEPDGELEIGEEYTIQLDEENIFDETENELRDDAEEIFSTCESYDMNASYDVDEMFDGDWIGFTIRVYANDYEDKDVKLVFDLPDGVSVQYQDGSDWEDLTNEDVYEEDGFELSKGIVDYFRASFESPGAYEIPVEFTTADSDEDVLFTIDMEMGRVALDEESRGVAGNGVIYDLDDETAYRVTETDSGDVYYTNEDGELEEDIDNMEALGNGVEMITGLDNDLEYMVEIPLSLEIHGITESAYEDYEFDFEITSIPNDDTGKEVEAYYLFNEDITLEYKNASDEWVEIENNEPLVSWTLGDGGTSEFRIDLKDAGDTTLTVEFWTPYDELMLGMTDHEFEVETE